MNRKIVLLLLLLPLSAHADISSDMINQSNLLLTLMSFFGIGILLAFTPCVLPMVPILSAILVGQNSQDTGRAFRLSLVFVLSMAMTYAVAGMFAGYLGSTLQTWMQQPWIIISFSLIFVIMALGMFGVFHLALPAFLQNKLHHRHNQLNNNYLGVAIMGLLSTLIASPCVTAPLLSVLTFISQTGSASKGGLILFAMALGMGVPLILFGVGQVTLLPKAGPWMNHIKNLFGLVILGLAIWMLSRVAPAPLILFLWASLLIISPVALGIFKWQSEHQSHPFWQGAGVLAFIYGILLLIGAASGHANPFQPLENNNAMINNEITTRPPSSLFTYIQTMPELQQKILESKNKKPIMIEFFAAWCPDCKQVDTEILSDNTVQKSMQPFTTIRVDLSERNPELAKIMKAYGVLGVPTMVFYDKAGNVFTDYHLKSAYITKSELQSILQKLS